jgi:uncharacterized protein YegL
VLLLDTSWSMHGAAIDELNAGLHLFKQALQATPQAVQSVEIAIVTFGPVQVHSNFHGVADFDPPLLTAQGNTPMGQAIMEGLNLLENHKMTLKSHGVSFYRPWVYLISDGGPTDEWQQAASRVRAGDNDQAKKFNFYAVGVGAADMATLAQICPPHNAPARLQGINFREMFKWLSASLTRVSVAKPNERIQLPAPTWTAST